MKIFVRTLKLIILMYVLNVYFFSGSCKLFVRFFVLELERKWLKPYDAVIINKILYSLVTEC